MELDRTRHVARSREPKKCLVANTEYPRRCAGGDAFGITTHCTVPSLRGDNQTPVLDRQPLLADWSQQLNSASILVRGVTPTLAVDQ
jgi:hypothetical protein